MRKREGPADEDVGEAVDGADLLQQSGREWTERAAVAGAARESMRLHKPDAATYMKGEYGSGDGVRGRVGAGDLPEATSAGVRGGDKARPVRRRYVLIRSLNIYNNEIMPEV